MAISPTTPIVVPAKSEKTADKFWITGLYITSPNFNQAAVTVNLLPYNSDSGETLPEKMVTLNLDNALELAQSDTELAQCLGTIYSLVDKYAKLQNLI